MSIHERYERSVCACHTCRTACETMPGSLHPDDLPRFADHLGLEVDSDEFIKWFMDHFVASDGIIAVQAGRIVRIGSIVPRQQENGHCVFLKDGHSRRGESCELARCSIHAASPFACGYFDCSEDGAVAQLKAEDMARGMMAHVGYRELWNHLHASGLRVATSVSERRAAWERARNSIRDAGG